ncbi:hypothetical protein MtrunA17_Chr5g0422131 [Medicago truncatula]|uniref:Uncharacterized protein n=1 Tax=Medicago truncatula TaxID=3880 RepID=A0A396HR22_MEDTR|nr:hypothetical protein MtrunA17_Chr5g0422131 [Medicago truncatula]
MTHSSTLKALDFRQTWPRASTSFSLLSFVLAVRFSSPMSSSSLFTLSLVVIRLSFPSIIKHTTLMHQSIKVSDLLNTHVLIDVRPKPTFKLHTLGNHSILRIDVGTKPCKLLKLRRILGHRHTPLLQIQELHFLPSPQILWKVLPQKLSLEPCPSHNLSTNLKSSLSIGPPILSLLSKHVSSQPHLLIITSHHSTKDPLHALQPCLSSIRVEPSLERRWIVSQETIKPPLLSFSLIPTTNRRLLIRLSQNLSHRCQGLCNRRIITTSCHVRTTQPSKR